MLKLDTRQVMTLPTGTILGITIGSIIGLFFILFLIWLITRLCMRGSRTGSKIDKRLDGKITLITGANSGIGKETAKDFYKRGARVIMLCRSIERGRGAIQDILEDIDSNPKDLGSLEVVELNLSSLQSIRNCAQTLHEELEQVDLLINNAGVAFVGQQQTEDGFNLTFGTNHLGHFLLTELLLPLLLKSAEHRKVTDFTPRIIIVASQAHKTSPFINWDDIHWEIQDFNDWKCYSSSKMANIMHAKELSWRWKDSGISVFSLHPGLIATELFRTYNDNCCFKCMGPLLKSILKTPLDGAQTTIYCALEESIDDKSGGYFVGCKEAAPHRNALIEEDRKRLWDLSEKLVGIV